jgi:hypothetical protein
VMDQVPSFLLFWAPVATLAALVLFKFSRKNEHRNVLIAGGGLLLACLYLLFIVRFQAQDNQRFYLELMVVHLPLACWIALGYVTLRGRANAKSRFYFLSKSIEVMIVAGIYLIAGVAFGLITMGMFQALSIELPDILMRLIAAGGFGLIPLLALISVYDPTVSPSEQDFSQGLSKLVATLMRLLLPLTVVVLVIYILVIPFNFMEPFHNRDVLIVYNLMLFGVMGLLIGATPISSESLPVGTQKLLHKGILTVAILTIAVSLYALSAVIFRTVVWGITINKLTIIGWNSINIVLLVLMVVRLIRAEEKPWTQRVKEVIGIGTIAYSVWTCFLVFGIPLIFR